MTFLQLMSPKLIIMQISNNEIHIDGFNIIRKDRNRFGGGVVLYVRQNISFSDRIDLIHDELEMVCIELSLPYNKSCTANKHMV